MQVRGSGTKEKIKNFCGHTPLGRPGQLAELASVYVQLQLMMPPIQTGKSMAAPVEVVNLLNSKCVLQNCNLNLESIICYHKLLALVLERGTVRVACALF